MDESQVTDIVSTSKIDLDKLLNNLSEVGLSHQGEFEDTDFFAKLIKIFPKKKMAEEDLEIGKKLAASLEKVLKRQMQDSSTIVSVICGICQVTGLPSQRVVGRVRKLMPALKVPSPSWISRNLKAASIVAANPSLERVKDVDKIVAIKRLPQDKFDEVVESGVIKISDTEVIDLEEAPKNQVTGAVKMICNASKVNTSKDDDLSVSDSQGEENSPIEMETVENAPKSSVHVEEDPEKIKSLTSKIGQVEVLLAEIKEEFPDIPEFSQKGYLIEDILNRSTKEMSVAIAYLNASEESTAVVAEVVVDAGEHGTEASIN